MLRKIRWRLLCGATLTTTSIGFLFGPWWSAGAAGILLLVDGVAE